MNIFEILAGVEIAKRLPKLSSEQRALARTAPAVDQEPEPWEALKDIASRRLEDEMDADDILAAYLNCIERANLALRDAGR